MEEKKELNLEGLKKELEACQKEKEEYLAGWQRARADFLNHKKEEMERITELLKYAGAELVLKLLPVLDNFYLAEKKLPENLKQDENIKGFFQVKTQVLDLLKNQGVEEIEATKGKFDPNFQEAVEEVVKEGVEAETVLEEVQKGYTLCGRVLRPAKVKISK